MKRQISVTKTQRERKSKMLHLSTKKQLGKLIHFFLKYIANIEKEQKCHKIKNYSRRKNVTLIRDIDKRAVKSTIYASSNQFSSFLFHLPAFFNVAKKKIYLRSKK